jgi:hypothetical protein
MNRLRLLLNPLVCNCDLRLTVLWCEERAVDAKATCRNQSSGEATDWTELKHVENCLGNQVPDVPSTGDNKLAVCDEVPAPGALCQVVLLVTVILIILLLTFHGVLAIIYFKRRREEADCGGDKPKHVDTNSDHNYQYDYILNSNIHRLPKFPSRPTQTNYCEKSEVLQVNTSLYSDNLDHVKSGALENEVGLAASGLCGASGSGDQFDQPYRRFESTGNKSDDAATGGRKYSCQESEHNIITGIPVMVKSNYVVPKNENLPKVTSSSDKRINSSSDPEVVVENYLYLERGAL